MMDMPDLRTNWKTTIVGAALVIACVVSVFVKECTWSEAMIGITCGLGLMFSKDHDN